MYVQDISGYRYQSPSRRTSVLQCAWSGAKKQCWPGQILLNKACKHLIGFIDSTGIVRKKNVLRGKIVKI